MRSSVMMVAILCALSFATPAARANPRMGGEVFGALNTYTMGNVNDFIDVTNTFDGTNFDHISTRFGGGLGARIWVAPHWMLDAVWEPLFAKTKSDASGASGEYDVGGNSFQLSGGYLFPATPTTRLGFGAGLGVYAVSGEITDGESSLDVEGSTVGFHLMSLGEWTVSPDFAVHAAMGYRAAKIDHTKFGGVETLAETDYSGLLARVGLAFYLPGTR